NSDARRYAAIALGEIGDSLAVKPLIAALKDKDLEVHCAAAVALGKIGDKQAVKPLIATFKDEDREVRREASIALGKIGDSRAVKTLIAALKDYRDVRCAAAEALGKIRDSQAVKPLIAVLEDENRDVRREAAGALDKLGWKPDMSEEGAFYWIAKTGYWEKCVKIGAPAVKPLIAALKDKNDYVRREAAIALGKIGDKRAVKPLMDAFKYEDWHVHPAAAEALGKIGAPAVKPLTAALKDKNDYVRGEAAKALGKIEDNRVVEPLLAALKDKDWDVRKAAANGLICIYKSGKISDVDKNSILACRSSISEEHHDSPASGSSSHSDVGIDIDFPY
ncbi:MAG: HEAT repeat domain-containing protein, partial [Actinobacteria bacterium]|nr:HEAT repeat domain-containing protein [Actinomycetota bacterium]